MNIDMGKSKHEILVYQDEDGKYIAECVTLPGCVSDGETRKDALNNVKEAIVAYLESLEKHREHKPVIKSPALVRMVV